AASLALLTQIGVDDQYFWNLFPAFVLGGAGLGLAFVPITIASLAGVERADAGIASGLVNTSRQIGGAIGLATVSAIAATASHGYASAHGVAATSGEALTHGFRVALVVQFGVLLAAAVVSAAFVRPHRAPQAQTVQELPLEEAA